MSAYKTKEFKKLQRQWDQRLEKAGFHDIEVRKAKGDLLKAWDSLRFKYFSCEAFNARQVYFELAAQFLHSHKFKNKTDKAIWALHSEGFVRRDIAKALRLDEWRIRNVVFTLRQLMLQTFQRGED